MDLRRALILLLFPLLAGCEMAYDLLEIPDPKKEAETIENEGRAVGSACRHSGRALEDCYLLNPKAQKSAIFNGWREMNDYMIANGMESVPSQLTPDSLSAPQAIEPPSLADEMAVPQ